MEVKEKYETPMMEMIEFNREEVVTMSGNGGTEPQQGDNFTDDSIMGSWSFPNKRILRNNLCLPACKLLYLDKREKNFLLTDIISDIIIVRN